MEITPNLARIADDFDRLAQLPQRRWSANLRLLPFIRKALPLPANRLLDVGAGLGETCRFLSTEDRQITGIDLSPEMLRLARERSSTYPGIDFVQGDYLQLDLPSDHFDAIVSVATVHHIDWDAFITKARRELKPGGRLIIVDLLRSEGLADQCRNLFYYGLMVCCNLWYNGILRTPKKERDLWDAHGQNDHYLSWAALQRSVAISIPGARIQRQLFWRYSLVWQKP